MVSLDAWRSWFRYHHLFGDLLRLELRRTEPTELRLLHDAAADWYAAHGHPLEAVRHAQAAGDWALAARVLSDHWFGLQFDGQTATADALLAGFPADAVANDPELAALVAAYELEQGSLEGAERHLTLATTEPSASVPADRRGHFDVLVTVLRLSLGRQRVDLPAVVEEAQRLLVRAAAPEAADLRVSEELRALALVSLGSAEWSCARFEEAQRHLEEGIALARRVERPHLELAGLVRRARAELRLPVAEERSMEAIDVARRHGWADQPIVADAYAALVSVTLWQGRLEETQRWLEYAERALRADAQPTIAFVLSLARISLEFAAGRNETALRAFLACNRWAERLVESHTALSRGRAFMMHYLVWMGETERVEQALAKMGERGLEIGEVRTTVAALRLAQGDPEAAAAALVPVFDGSAALLDFRPLQVHAFLLEALDAQQHSLATRSGTLTPPSARSSARSISPSPTAFSCPSSSMPRPHWWSATRGTAPLTRPWSRRSSTCCEVGDGRPWSGDRTH